MWCLSSTIIPLCLCSLKKYGVLCRLAEDNQALSKQKEKLQEKLEKYTVFHRYMEKVLEAGEEFHELRDIIARWDTLTATHQVQHSSTLLSQWGNLLCNNENTANWRHHIWANIVQHHGYAKKSKIKCSMKIKCTVYILYPKHWPAAERHCCLFLPLLCIPN